MEGMTKRKDGGIQLKRMESGSLLAICAMCFSMSFFVMIPSSLLMAKKEREKSERTSHRTSYHTSSWKVKDRKQRRTVEV